MGFLPVLFPPETGFPETAVRGLPLPVDPAELVAFHDQHGPEFLEHPVLDESLEPTVDRAVIPERLGQEVPLDPTSETEDDPVEDLAEVGPGSAPSLRRIPLSEDRFQAFPTGVGNLPDGLEWDNDAAATSAACHGTPLAARSARETPLLSTT